MVTKSGSKTCTCITPQRRAEIEVHMDIASDFTDGAWLAYMEGAGVDISELEVFDVNHDCQR